MDEDLTGRTGDLLAGLAMFRDASVPTPSPELAALFAATATTAPSALPTPRRAPVYKRFLAGIPSKVAAGALGALLAGSVGAGALTGTMVLTSNEDDSPAVEAPAVEDSTVVADEHEDVADVEDDAAEDADGIAVDEVDDDGANDAAAGADLAAVPVPTSVSEAAHTHEFDEACGNHGRYVSHFAQTGTEPDCAVEARAAAAAEGEDGAADAEAVVADADGNDDGADAATSAEHKGNGHHKTSPASKSSKGGKGKSGR
jgi:hypothetical protein